jgi:hypothetical protein
VRETGASTKDGLIRLDVYPWGEFHAYEGVTTENTYRDGEPGWSVSLPSGERFNVFFCPLPLITDDGNYLVLLGNTSAGGSALRIYRRPKQSSTEGVLVRQIDLREIWPEDKWPAANEKYDMNELRQPEWFKGGKFSFSPDCRNLIYGTRWGTTVHINLANGAVFRR